MCEVLYKGYLYTVVHCLLISFSKILLASISCAMYLNIHKYSFLCCSLCLRVCTMPQEPSWRTVCTY